MNRRNFIKNMTATVGSLSHFSKIGGGLSLVTSNLLAQTTTSPTDGYKAIVVINLSGGNDAMNTFPPTGETTHAEYEKIRTNLAVKKDNLKKSVFYKIDSETKHYKVDAADKQPYWPNDNAPLGSDENKQLQYTIGSYHTQDENGKETGLGIHAFMPELAALYDNKKLSIVSNVGTLVKPAIKGENGKYRTKIPPFVFSHLHQYYAVSRLDPNMENKTGWAGRLADKWQVDGILGLNLTYTGGSDLFRGNQTSGFRLSGAGIVEYNFAGTNEIIKELRALKDDNHLIRIYNDRMGQSVDLIESINQHWDKAPNFKEFTAKNSYGSNLFSRGGVDEKYRRNLGMRIGNGFGSTMFEGLKDTAKMIKVTKDEFKSNRQVFSINETGYDFHGGQMERHSERMRALSMAVSDFYKALQEMEMEKEVLVVMTSEFGRTLRSNSDGTDHGWGGHSFILCGDPKFNGGRVFGKVMDDLKIDGPNAFTNRARIIPTTSTEQMFAPILNWFGVDEETMTHVLPNLSAFRTDANNTQSAFLKGVFS